VSAGAEAVRSPHRLILASAGSGKTFQLTNAMIGRLLAGEPASNLLATTFTRAAAGEILHRALARLSDAAVEEEALKEIRAHVDPGATRRRCAEALERVVSELHRLSVMTIDAFFSRLATSFAFELGLAPGWRMIDEEEDERLRSQAVERALREAPPKEMFDLLRDLHGEGIRSEAHSMLMRLVKENYSAYLGTIDNEAAWSAIEPSGAALDGASIAAAMDALNPDLVPQTAKGLPDKRWMGALSKAVDAIDAADWEGLLESGLGKALFSAAAVGGEPAFYGKPFPDALSAALLPVVEHARHRLTTTHAARTRAARSLLERFDSAYTERKRAAGGVTFDDPLRLLTEAEATGRMEHLRFRLDARIGHVLLDEFQDTSLTQFRLLAPILDELLSQAEEGRSVFCVGDVKQSLYAWRDAEPTLLPALPGRWPSLRTERLSESWRSSQAVLDGVNAIFSTMRDNPALCSEKAGAQAAGAWDDGFGVHTAAKKDLPGAVYLTVADEPEAEEAISSAEAYQHALVSAAMRVKAAHERAPGASIAVLLRRGADIRTMLALLKRFEVDASERRGNPLVDTPAVAAAASMLRLVDHPGCTAALRHVALTPLGEAVGLTDPSDLTAAQRVASRWRGRIAARGCAEALSEWLRLCAPSMDARSLARFEQCVHLAEDFDAEARGEPGDLAAILDTRRVDEAGGAPVRVMTIHASKGLEFDVVVLPLVAMRAWQVDSRGVLVGRDDPLGEVTRVTRYPNATMRLLHPGLAAMHEEALKRTITEELCCLYVAATRAKRLLEMVVSADKAGRDDDALEEDQWRLRPDHIVRAALAPHAPAAPGETLWSRRTDGAEWCDGVEQARVEEDAPAPEARLRVRAGERRSAARLASAAPSSEAGDAPIDAAGLLVARPAGGREMGEAIHHWFEQIEWLDGEDPDDASLVESARALSLPDELIRRALPVFRKALEAVPVREALSREPWLSRRPEASDAAAQRERPFAVRDRAGDEDEGERLLQGRFDRLVIGRAGGRPVCAEVLDFKTDHAAADLTGEALDAYARRHRPQMDAYRRAAARLLRLPEERVDAALLFTAAGGVARLSPEGE